MTNLFDAIGLQIHFDENLGKIVYSENINFIDHREVKISDITPVLLNKFLKYPEQVYIQHVGVCDCGVDCSHGSVHYDIFEMPSGLLGIEYIKSHVYHTNEVNGKFACIIEVVKGELLVITQRNDPADYVNSFNTRAKDINIIRLFEGDKVSIPSGLYFTFINVGSEKTVFTVISNNLDYIDYNVLSREKGLAYFVICKNARLEIVANPKYKINEPPSRYVWSRMPKERKTFYTNDFTEKKKTLYEFFKTSINQLATVLV